MREDPSAAAMQWVRPAKQERSAKTHELFLDTVEAMLEEQGVHQLQVKDIAARANLSVGGFYSRFVTREGVLRAVHERFAVEAVATASTALAPSRWAGTSLADATPQLVGFLADDYRRRPGFRRALVVMAATDAELLPRAQQVTAEVTAAIAAFLDSKAAEMTTPLDVRGTAELVHRLLFATLDNHVLTAPSAGRALPFDTLVVSLTRVIAAVLGC